MNLTARNIRPGYMILLCLLAISLLIDLGSGIWLYKYATILLLFLSGLLFINYKWWWASICSISIFFICKALKFPRLANHGNLEMGVILLVLCALFLKFSGFKLKKTNPQLFSQTFRYALITIYFIAGFHKLNSGFLMLEGSCVKSVNMFFNPLLFGEDFITSPIIIKIMQYGALFVELVVPFGLLLPRLRKATVWILVLFHFYLSFCNFSNFSSFAGFLIAGSILDLTKNYYPKKLIRALRIYILFSILSVITVYIVQRFSLLPSQLFRLSNGLVFNIGWIVFFSVLLADKNIHDTEPYKGKKILAPFLPVILLVLWASQPYIGLSTTGTITMFSNLLTEESRSNHYLINTKYTKIWHLEEDYVTVLKLSENIEKKLHYINYDIPITEFKFNMYYYARDSGKKADCTLLYKGKKIYIPDIANSEFSHPRWWYKYIQFRKIPQKGVNECMW